MKPADIVVGKKYRNHQNNSIYLGTGLPIYKDEKVKYYTNKKLIVLSDGEYTGHAVYYKPTSETNMNFWNEFYPEN